MKITKEEFEKVVNKYPPNGWIRFAFKHFGKDGKDGKIIWTKFSNMVTVVLVLLFLIGFAGTISNAPRWVIKYSIMSYSIFLSIVVFYLLSAFLMNDFRLKKIMKDLNITPNQYDDLVKEFYN